MTSIKMPMTYVSQVCVVITDIIVFICTRFLLYF